MTRFTVRPSRYLAITFICAHGGAAALIFPLQIPIAAKVTLCLMIAASLAHALARHALLCTRNAITRGCLYDGANARVMLRDGKELEAEILGTTYVSPSLTVLNLRAAGKRLARHVLLVPDNVDREDYRKLRVVLKWARSHGGTTRTGGSDPPGAW